MTDETFDYPRVRDVLGTLTFAAKIVLCTARGVPCVAGGKLLATRNIEVLDEWCADFPGASFGLLIPEVQEIILIHDADFAKRAEDDGQWVELVPEN